VNLIKPPVVSHEAAQRPVAAVSARGENLTEM
jgi:hypothetical protein